MRQCNNPGCKAYAAAATPGLLQRPTLPRATPDPSPPPPPLAAHPGALLLLAPAPQRCTQPPRRPAPPRAIHAAVRTRLPASNPPRAAADWLARRPIRGAHGGGGLPRPPAGSGGDRRGRGLNRCAAPLLPGAAQHHPVPRTSTARCLPALRTSTTQCRAPALHTPLCSSTAPLRAPEPPIAPQCPPSPPRSASRYPPTPPHHIQRQSQCCPGAPGHPLASPRHPPLHPLSPPSHLQHRNHTTAGQENTSFSPPIPQPGTQTQRRPRGGPSPAQTVASTSGGSSPSSRLYAAWLWKGLCRGCASSLAMQLCSSTAGPVSVTSYL